MLNGRVMLLGVLCVLFVPSISLSQTELSDAEIIKEINASERRTRDHIDTKTKSTDTKISEINTKIGTINTNVAVNTTNMENMQVDINDLKGTVTWIWRGVVILIIGSVAIPIGLYFLKQWWENRGNKDSPSKVDPSKVDTQSYYPQREFPSRDKLIDELQSDYYGEKRKV